MSSQSAATNTHSRVTRAKAAAINSVQTSADVDHSADLDHPIACLTTTNVDVVPILATILDNNFSDSTLNVYCRECLLQNGCLQNAEELQCYVVVAKCGLLNAKELQCYVVVAKCDLLKKPLVELQCYVVVAKCDLLKKPLVGIDMLKSVICWCCRVVEVFSGNAEVKKYSIYSNAGTKEKMAIAGAAE
ncbi:hypothetical protein Patl1_23743 [Pistacia atlantica]|uniref:Uncharacterized protein n=1 Tax=Pistacia atlantica TaxID=434234 RepID=A0ACC0ZX02_9ROSI|nr:hypothetical protein Patl1_23743 [Pistacia atlantica]